jgi:hypothetical protein
MAASAIPLVDVDVAYDGPVILKLSRRHPYGLALLDYKMQGIDSVERYGHLKRVQADAVGVLVRAFAADTSVHAARRRRPAGPFQPGGAGRLIPPIEDVTVFNPSGLWSRPGRAAAVGGLPPGDVRQEALLRRSS